MTIGDLNLISPHLNDIHLMTKQNSIKIISVPSYYYCWVYIEYKVGEKSIIAIMVAIQLLQFDPYYGAITAIMCLARML